MERLACQIVTPIFPREVIYVRTSTRSSTSCDRLYRLSPHAAQRSKAYSSIPLRKSVRVISTIFPLTLRDDDVADERAHGCVVRRLKADGGGVTSRCENEHNDDPVRTSVALGARGEEQLLEVAHCHEDLVGADVPRVRGESKSDGVRVALGRREPLQACKEKQLSKTRS